ncbi:MAG: branched-chain amino acid ABC transporter permease [Candidatus Competibacterales bacterium]
MDIFLQLVANGVVLGGMYALIAVGLTLIFGVVRVINFAHGELLMVGMYTVYLITAATGLHPYLTALPVMGLLFVVGLTIQWLIIQPLLNAKHEIQIFATVGLSTALINLALLVFGADLQAAPAAFARSRTQLGEVSLVNGHLLMLAVAVVVIVGLHVFLHHSRFGRAIRATAQHREAAALMGIDVHRVYRVTFGIGAACVGLAAALMMGLYPVFPTVGTYFVLTAFVVTVLGGMGSLFGALIGAMIIGLVDSLSGYYIAPDLKEVVYFVLFLAILLVRPTGLFGLGRGSE